MEDNFRKFYDQAVENVGAKEELDELRKENERLLTSTKTPEIASQISQQTSRVLVASIVIGILDKEDIDNILEAIRITLKTTLKLNDRLTNEVVVLEQAQKQVERDSITH